MSMLTPTERAIALTIFSGWGWGEDETPDDMAPSTIADLAKKWDEQFMPSLTEPHCGDCTKVAMPCTRCHTEGVIETAKKIAAAIGA